jgi:glycosyltransferase involved in cell wall biosynthesis
MKHLAVFLPSLGGGGAEKVMLTLVEHFTARGVRCDLVVAINGGQLTDQVPPGVRLIEFGKRKTIHAVAALANYLRRDKPDALLATVFSANTCALLASALAPGKRRTVVCESSLSEMAYGDDVSVRVQVNRMLASALYRKAHKIVAISKGVRESILRTYSVRESDVRIIYNPICSARNLGNGVHKRRDNLLVACGRLEPPKDYPTMLRAFARVLQQHDARLRILGQGSLREVLEQQCADLGITDRVIFEGFVRDPGRRMCEATVFLHTASFEGFGLVLAEALANGCPVVATDCPGGVREVLDGGKYGILVPVGDDAALANAILSVLREEVKVSDPSEHLHKFDTECVAEQYMEVLFQ